MILSGGGFNMGEKALHPLLAPADMVNIP